MARTAPEHRARITANRQAKMPSIATTSYLTDARIKALTDFNIAGLHRDKGLPNLLLRVGKKRVSWVLLDERRINGSRQFTSKVLGQFPTLSAIEARRQAHEIMGKIAEGKAEPGKRKAVKFETALDKYLAHLRRKAAANAKPARWAYNVTMIAKKHLLPKFAKWSLAMMSRDPQAIHDFHIELTERAGPVTGNQAIKIVRAVYRFEARLNRSLPHELPSSAVVFNKEAPRQTSVMDWPAWRAAWEVIGSPTRKAYHLFCLAGGFRPGEAARARWRDIDVKARTITITGAKAGDDIIAPLSILIVKALRLARDAMIEPSEWVFPGSGKSGHIARGDDGLPVHGNSLRHNYRTICGELEISDLVSSLLLGHALQGVSRKYVHILAMQSGAAMRAAQRAVSKRIVSLLGQA